MLAAQPVQRLAPRKRVVFADKKKDSRSANIKSQSPKSFVPERPKNPRPTPCYPQSDRKPNYPTKGNVEIFHKNPIFVKLFIESTLF